MSPAGHWEDDVFVLDEPFTLPGGQEVRKLDLGGFRVNLPEGVDLTRDDIVEIVLSSHAEMQPLVPTSLTVHETRDESQPEVEIRCIMCGKAAYVPVDDAPVGAEVVTCTECNR